MKSSRIFFAILCSDIFRTCYCLICDGNSEFLCRSFDHNFQSCLKFGQKCSNDVSIWKDYPLANLSFIIEPISSGIISLSSRTDLSNVSRIRFELGDFLNSTFFRKHFDAGIELTNVDDSVGKIRCPIIYCSKLMSYYILSECEY